MQYISIDSSDTESNSDIEELLDRPLFQIPRRTEKLKSTNEHYDIN